MMIFSGVSMFTSDLELFVGIDFETYHLISSIVLLVLSGFYFIILKRIGFRPIGLVSYFSTLLFLAYLFFMSTADSGGMFYLIGFAIFGLLSVVFGSFVQLAVVFISALVVVSQFFVQDLMVLESITSLLILITPVVVAYVMWARHVGSYDSVINAAQKKKLDYEKSSSDAIVESITDGVAAVDNDGVITRMNPAGTSMLGMDSNDATLLSYKSVFVFMNDKNHILDDANSPIFIGLDKKAVQKTDKLQLQTKSGKKFMVDLSVSPVSGGEGGVIVVFRDVTNLKQEEKQKAEFISTASHEMRTPVAAMEGYLGLVLNPNTATIDDRARGYTEKAKESAQHLGKLFQDLLDISKADDGRLSQNPKAIDLVPFVEGIVSGLTPKAEDKGILAKFLPKNTSLDSEKKPMSQAVKTMSPVMYVHADKNHLREMLDNLVENAIKYTPEGEVVVDVQSDEKHVTVSIKDTGVGIPKEDISHLFQKFYRVDNSDTREIGGTGLGLYLCRRLAESMNGRIWVESEYKQGSTFYVELPRLSSSKAQELLSAQKDDEPEAVFGNGDATNISKQLKTDIPKKDVSSSLENNSIQVDSQEALGVDVAIYSKEMRNSGGQTINDKNRKTEEGLDHQSSQDNMNVANAISVPRLKGNNTSQAVVPQAGLQNKVTGVNIGGLQYSQVQNNPLLKGVEKQQFQQTQPYSGSQLKSSSTGVLQQPPQSSSQVKSMLTESPSVGVVGRQSGGAQNANPVGLSINNSQNRATTSSYRGALRSQPDSTVDPQSGLASDYRRSGQNQYTSNSESLVRDYNTPKNYPSLVKSTVMAESMKSVSPAQSGGQLSNYNQANVSKSNKGHVQSFETYQKNLKNPSVGMVKSNGNNINPQYSVKSPNMSQFQSITNPYQIKSVVSVQDSTAQHKPPLGAQYKAPLNSQQYQQPKISLQGSADNLHQNVALPPDKKPTIPPLNP